MVCTHSYLGNIDVAVAGGNHAKVFLADALALSGKLCYGTKRGGLGGLTASVGVNLCVEHKDVDVFAAGNYVVETTIANVVAGTIAADNPLAALG